MAKNTVADALSTLNTNVNNVAGVAVKYDAAGGNKITLGATGGTGTTSPVKITNLTAGALTSTSTDAVNGSQLFTTNTNLTNLTNLTNQVNSSSLGLVQQVSSGQALTVGKIEPDNFGLYLRSRIFYSNSTRLKPIKKILSEMNMRKMR